MIKAVCQCGHTDDANNFITVGKPYKVKDEISHREVYDYTWKCPKCGFEQKKTVVNRVISYPYMGRSRGN